MNATSVRQKRSSTRTSEILDRMERPIIRRRVDELLGPGDWSSMERMALLSNVVRQPLQQLVVGSHVSQRLRQRVEALELLAIIHGLIPMPAE